VKSSLACFSPQSQFTSGNGVYVCVPPNRLANARVLLNLFFAQLINLNTAELPEHNPALKHQCLVLLDEFTALGRI
jgi:type IV secretion system protein VirD4